MHKKLDLENTRIKNINIIYRMAKGFITRHRRKLRNKKSRSKRRVRGGNGGIWGWFSRTPQNQPQYPSQNTNTPSNFNQMNTEGNPGMQRMNTGYGEQSMYPSGSTVPPSEPSYRQYNTGMGGKRRRPRRSARKVKRSVRKSRKGRKSRRTRRMRGGSNGYTINGAGIGKYTSALANPIPFSAYPLNR